MIDAIWEQGALFVDAAAGPDGEMCLVLSDQEHTETRVPFGRLAFLIDGQWRHGGDVNWDIVAVARCSVPLSQYAIVGTYGDARFVGSGDVHNEEVADGDHAPERYGLLRGLRSIDGRLVACGMNRQVYRRDGANDWKLIFEPRPSGDTVVGFEAIDGFGLDDIYAVGWEGEIWQYDGILWHLRQGSTNRVMVDVCCAGDGRVYILCHGRKMIIGRHDQWQVLDLELRDDLWSLAWYQGELYACSSCELYRFRDGAFVPLPPAGDRPSSFQSLKLGHERLMTIGAQDLCAFDGSTWSRVAPMSR